MAKTEAEVYGLFNKYKLTDEQKDFLIAYITTHNATQSFIDAFNFEGKRESAKVLACVELKKPDVASALDELRQTIEVDFKISPAVYLDTLIKVATSDIGNYIKFAEEEIPIYDEVGLPVLDQDTGEQLTKKINKMHLVDSSTVDTSIITEIKQGKDGVTIKLMDKMKAWEKLSDYFGWLNKEAEKLSESTANRLIDALNKNANNSWKDVDNDLEELEKDFK